MDSCAQTGAATLFFSVLRLFISGELRHTSFKSFSMSARVSGLMPRFSALLSAFSVLRAAASGENLSAVVI
jgi:hypothetical protein